MTTVKINKKSREGRQTIRGGYCLPFAMLLALTLFFFPLPTRAADFCLDVLALAKHDANMIAEEMPAGWYIGALDNTWGDVIPNLETIASKGKLGGFRVHLRNTVCVRNRNCEKTEPKYDDFQALGRDAAKYEAFHKRYPNSECLLSPWLEHDVKDRAKVQRAVDTIKKAAPSCTVVNSTFTGVSVPGVLSEKHGNSAKADVVSNDGQSLFDSDSVEYRTQGKRLVCGWIHQNNGRVSGEKTFVAPSKRVNWATRDDIKQMVRVLLPQTMTPADRPRECKSARRVGEEMGIVKGKKQLIKNNEIWKTNAEYYGKANADVRGNKPLLISKLRTPMLYILAPDGRKVGCAKYYGPFQNGYNRHYVGSCSGDTPISLMDKARSEWLYLNDGGACIRVNAIRRKGSYR